uniref:Uncharacterized protein n=1 Tax=Romanomermis culicivorax TaxID=13658 RepID=A0A915IG25_ROMCU
MEQRATLCSDSIVWDLEEDMLRDICNGYGDKAGSQERDWYTIGCNGPAIFCLPDRLNVFIPLPCHIKK